MSRQGMLLGDEELEVRGAMLQAGSAAPDFVLTANNWAKKSLADYAAGSRF